MLQTTWVSGSHNIYSKIEISSSITPVFSVTWSFWNHSNVLIWSSRNIYHYYYYQYWDFYFKSMLILSTCIFCRLKSSLEDKPHDKLPLGDSTVETVKSLHLQLGRERVQCTAQVIGQTSKFLQSLLEMHCLLRLKNCSKQHTHTMITSCFID